jgi:hypothetical protein
VKVLVNNYGIDFKFDSENSWDDFFESLNKWFSERGLIFFEVDIDGEIYPADEIPKMKIASIEVMNCSVNSKADMIFGTIGEGITYSDKVINFISSTVEKGEIDLDEIKNLVVGIDWFLNVNNSLINLIEVNEENVKHKDKTIKEQNDDLLKLKDRFSSLDENDDIDVELSDAEIFNHEKEILRILGMSKEMKNLVLRSFDSPDQLVKRIEKVKESIPEELKNIEDVAIAFQTGKDKEGADGINHFVEFILFYINLCYQISPVFGIDLSKLKIENDSLEDKNITLKSLLGQTMEVMENNDIISLADILEYEMIPAIEEIDKYIDLIIDKVV